MMFYILIGCLLYFVVGVLKLKFFDFNNEGDWLMMWSDPRSRRCEPIWLYVGVLIVWFTWPIILFSRTKYKKIDEEVFEYLGDRDENGHEKATLVKTGKKRKMLVGPKGFSIASILFKLQWAGVFGIKKSLRHR